MTNEQLEIIEFELKHSLYFIQYPKNVTENWWKDGEGKLHNMSSMGLDHLKACTRTVEKGIKYLEESGRNPKIVNSLIPLARQKLLELNDAFIKKINS